MTVKALPLLFIAAPIFFIGALVIAAETRKAGAIEDVCVPNIEEREHIRKIIIEASDEGLKNHLVGLFDVWMKERGGETGRGMTGARLAINAYIRARASALKFDPPICAERK